MPGRWDVLSDVFVVRNGHECGGGSGALRDVLFAVTRNPRARSTRALLLGARDILLAVVNVLSRRLARATFRRRYR